MNSNLLTTSSDWLKYSTDELTSAGIKSARLDSLLILEELLKLPRINLISANEVKISEKETKKLNSLLERRLKNEPMAYIRGHCEFFGREFYVDNKVLIPRPESEDFISLLLKLNPSPGKLADIGCGSGCLGITIKLEIPDLEVDLIDISKPALSVAKSNATKLRAKVNAINSDFIDVIDKQYSIVVANLPYVPQTMKHKSITFEPDIALFGGVDGLDVYRLFWEEVANIKSKPNHIFTESLPDQHEQMFDLAKSSGYKLKVTSVLVQEFELV